jgi:hypothetical protein
MGGRGWARWTGIITAIILAVLLILGGLTSLGNDAGSGVGSLVVGALYALSAWALIQATAFFAYRR